MNGHGWQILGSAGRVWAPRVNPRCQVVDRGNPRTTVDPTTRSRYFCNNQVKPDQTALGKNTSLRKCVLGGQSLTALSLRQVSNTVAYFFYMMPWCSYLNTIPRTFLCPHAQQVQMVIMSSAGPSMSFGSVGISYKVPTKCRTQQSGGGVASKAIFVPKSHQAVGFVKDRQFEIWVVNFAMGMQNVFAQLHFPISDFTTGGKLSISNILATWCVSAPS